LYLNQKKALMAIPNREEKMREIVTKELKPGEELLHVSFGAQKPNLPLIIVLAVLFLFIGLIVWFFMRNYYFVALTNERLIVIRFKSGFKVKEVESFNLKELGETLETKVASRKTEIGISSSKLSFRANFENHWSNSNLAEANAIVNAIN
jgi:uncharacterized membrane protein YqiK